ncbi:hypothetical protein Bhyg_13161 [Pseudolycoriella hygida]|uniref:Uncharacterized protein n=1 Tax=Pseudolycoriella hygida TaxID=35572 RepID=A0A9Q0RW32_9DIPT|nr:hypothetical protein Bhyg_13161 [Pseudolycoriella hygida]
MRSTLIWACWSKYLGSAHRNIEDSHNGFAHLDLDQIEFISEPELASLEGYEVLMDFDLELLELKVHSQLLVVD